MRLQQLFSRRASFFANTALLAGGAGLSQIVIALTAPLLTRLYSPADFGAYAVLLALANFGAVVASLRYDTAIILPKTDRAAANLAVLSLALVVLIALASVPLAALLLWGAAGLRGTQFAPALAVLLPFSIAAFGVQQVLRAWLMRAHLFAAATLTGLAQAIAMVALQIAAGLAWGSSAFNLAAASLIGTVIGSLVALPALHGEVLRHLHAALSSRRVVAMARRYRRFALYGAPYSFVAQISQRGPVLILAALGTVVATGAFALAQRIVYLPIGVVVNALSQAFYRHAAGRLQAADVQALVRRVLLGAVLIAGPVFAAAAFNMEALFAFVFGETWRVAGHHAAWLTLAGFTVLLTYWLDRVYDMTGRQRLALGLELGFNLVSLAVFSVMLYRTKNAEEAVAALAMTIALYSALYLAVTLHVARISERLFYETLLAALAAGLYGALAHYAVRGLVGYGTAYGVLVTALVSPPAVLGALLTLGKISLPPLHPSNDVSGTPAGRLAP
jgi:O-antigen/teichoic acid export membrane protein